MKIEITIDGVTRIYAGDFEMLRGRDWEDIVRDFMDDVDALKNPF